MQWKWRSRARMFRRGSPRNLFGRRATGAPCQRHRRRWRSSTSSKRSRATPKPTLTAPKASIPSSHSSTMDEHELHPRISHTAHECGLLPLMVDAGADSSPMIRAAVLFCEREGASDVSEVRLTEGCNATVTR
eukprot:3100371-Prymnesium_polylepis.1